MLLETLRHGLNPFACIAAPESTKGQYIAVTRQQVWQKVHFDTKEMFPGKLKVSTAVLG